MHSSQSCSSCGAHVPSGARVSVCATCLLQTGLDIVDEAAPADGTDLADILARPASPLGVKFHSFGDYELLEEIARGGMGVVFKAQQASLHRIVAVKVIQAGRLASPDAVRRFRREAQAAARFDHPNIVPIYEVGEHQGHHYFSMKLVEGGNLAGLAAFGEGATCQPMGTAELSRRAATLVAKVAHAVHHAHQHGIIHRDLKPGNILLDRLGEPLVTDFGLAKFAEQDTGLTLVGDIMGTPGYMSPEQAAGKVKELTTASDIWSMGAILYKLLAGRPPFCGATAIETLRLVTEREPAALRPLNGAVDRDLETICFHCLEKDPARRYPSADALATDLEHWLEHEPISARPVRPLERVWKWSQRQPMLAASVLLLNVVLVLGVGAVVWQWHRAEDNADKEHHQRQRAEEVLQRMQMQHAEALFGRGDSVEAVAYLADGCRRNPANRPAAERLLSALVQRTFLMPAAPPLRHSAQVCSVQFSPDGRSLLTAAGNSARVWDPVSGRPLSKAFKHAAIIRSARLSPDGRQVVAGFDDGVARVWDVQSGEPVTGPLQHEGRLSATMFSPNGRQILTCMKDGAVHVWDLQTGEPLFGPLKHSGGISSVVFSPDGQRIATGSPDGTARVWDARDGRALTEPLRHSNMVFSVQFSPDSRRLLTASGDGLARVWDAGTGQLAVDPMKHEGRVRFAAFSPDGRRIATASADRTARVWNAQTGRPLTGPLWHAQEVEAARFSPDGRSLVTSSDDRTLRIWDAQNGQPLIEPLKQEANLLIPIFSPDGRRVLTVSRDIVRLWYTQPGQPLADPLRHDADIRAIAYSADGRRIVTAAGKTAQVWDVRSGRRAGKPFQHEGAICSAEFSPDSRRVATASRDHTARVWDAQSGEPLTGPLQHHGVTSAKFTPDGGRLLTASEEGTARIWDVRTGEPLSAPLEHRQTDTNRFAQFSPDGRYVIAASDGRTAQVWDSRNGQAVGQSFKHADTISSAQFSPDNLRVVTASEDRTARVWDVRTGQPVTEPLKHNGPVRSAQFSSDGRRVVTVWRDSARVWDAESGRPLTEPLTHASAVRSAQFSADGRRVVTASDDHNVRVWDAESGQPLADPLRHCCPVVFAQFSPDGQSVATASANEVRIWPLPALGERAVPWLAGLAEGMGGWRLNVTGVLEPAPEEQFMEAKNQIAALPLTSPVTFWGKWIVADRDTRSISPRSLIKVPEYIQRRITEDKLDGLREAVSLDPNNALAMARLARQMTAQRATPNHHGSEEIAWLIERALKLAPNDIEILEIQKAILEAERKSVP